MWQLLDDELARWRDNGQRATLWCRDDDACRDSPALRRLLAIAASAHVPVAFAVIPAGLEPSLVAAVGAAGVATVVQHGYAHHNHAPPAERKCELGAQRPAAAVVAEVRQGRDTLAQNFGTRFAPVLVPPWNRIASEIVGHLADAGFRGLSTFGPRASASAAPDLVQCNTHVDLIAWRRGRAFVGPEAAIARLVEHLQARRSGRTDAAEPTGILSHHLDLDESAWQFLTELVARTNDRGTVDWLDVRAAFAPVTSSRSA